MSKKTIALDAMGGDFGPSVVLPATKQALLADSDLHVIFVGDQAVLSEKLRDFEQDFSGRFELVHASEVVAMDESPSLALRNKKDSSMRVAINLVKSGRAQAVVSAGNTGALMATARFVLKTLPGIDRPAIITRFPSRTKQEVRVLDLGANVDSSPEQLRQFAIMGSILVAAVDNNPTPSVGLINVGEEEIKGNELVKQTSALLQETSCINYHGYVEGDAIFNSTVDVIVCDGFVGNVMLKACEGLSKLMTSIAREEFRRNLLSRISALLILPVLKRLKKRFDMRERNGATLIGLEGVVIKSHGGADVKAFTFAIAEAILEIDKDVLGHMRSELAQLAAEEA